MTLPAAENVRETLEARVERGDGLRADSIPRCRKESLLGLGCSLLLHTGLVVAMAGIALELSEREEIGALSGVLNPTPSEAVADLIIDSPEPIEPTSEDAPSEFEHLVEQLSESHTRRAMTSTYSGAGEGSEPGNGEAVAVPTVSVPSYAVTKGSFSAWTVPEDPEPTQPYVIRIVVRLPGDWNQSAKFRLRDISGMVIGTDGYKQVIRFKTTQLAEVQDGAVQIDIPVPGARKLVRDTIRIESKLLKEKQVLQLVF